MKFISRHFFYELTNTVHRIWKRIAKQSPEFGNPEKFCSDPEKTNWESATVTTLDEKIALLGDLGVDNVIVIPFDRAFSALTGAEFVEEYLIEKVGAETLVAGYNHRFGHDRVDCDALAATGPLKVVKVGPCTVDGVRVSSTLIRRLLEEGKTEEAARLRGVRLKSGL